MWNPKSQIQRKRVMWWLSWAPSSGNREILVEGYKLPVIILASSVNLMYSMVITAKNTLSYT